MEARVAEGEDATIRRDQPVALPRRRRGHPDDRLVEPDRAGRPEETRVAETEDAAIRRDQPVALPRRCRRHPHDRLRQPHRAGRPEETRVAETEDAAIRRDQPVAAIVEGGGHPDDGIPREAGGGAVVRGVAEGEDSAVTREQPEAVDGPGADGGGIEGDHGNRRHGAATCAVRVPRDHGALVRPAVGDAGDRQR